MKRNLSTLEYVNLGRAKRGVPPLDKLPSFYDSPFDYPDAYTPEAQTPGGAATPAAAPLHRGGQTGKQR